ncbi:ABC transporter permease [Geotalea sp. SG265]|uniref:ABC transporter permease n=1 Tax=Geotalea sp. SG265 TaxID=2922867 RepID=UPI001FAFC82D|nr:ABC transporter permease [Geotalea sp. SG265]
MKTRILQVSVVILLLALWQVLPQLEVINPHFLPPLSEVVKTIHALLAAKELQAHILISLKRISAGLLVALLVGAPLGLLMGWFREFEQVVDAPLQAGRQISALALFPVFILLFGIGEVSKAIIIFWASFWPILLNSIVGVKNIDPILIRSARSMDARGVKLLVNIIIPAAAPSMFTGIRLGASYAFMVLVAAEMVGANSGLGFLVLNSQETFRIPEMYAAIITLCLFGLLINHALLLLEQRATKWRQLRANG